MKTNEGTPSPNEVKDRESALKVLRENKEKIKQESESFANKIKGVNKQAQKSEVSG
jgi:hypothetical protein